MDARSVFDHAERDELSLEEYLANARELEQEAVEAIPFALRECTYKYVLVACTVAQDPGETHLVYGSSLGHVKQPLWSCLTCQRANNGVLAGICATCSVQCHSDHEQVELFSRRHFQCDCGTTRCGPDACCNIGKRLGQAANTENSYDDNFRNIFCVCRKEYDYKTEVDEMLQCIVCENWLHSHCVIPVIPSSGNDNGNGEEDLVLPLDDFDTLICPACVKSKPSLHILRRYAGKPGTGVLFVDKDLSVRGKVEVETSPALGQKRDRSLETSSGEQEQDAKRPRLDVDKQADPVTEESNSPTVGADSACAAPDDNVLPELEERLALPDAGPSIFLQEGFRERWCTCPQCKPLFEAHPYLVEEEDALDLEEEDEEPSMEDKWSQNLQNLPRAAVLDYLRGMDQLKTEFSDWIRSLPRQEGKELVITDSMVKDWMNSVKQKQEQSG